MNSINNFLDSDGKIKIWPSKHEMKLKILIYLSDKFQYGRTYTEKEVNALINHWHSFGDYFLLRRGLIENNLLCRKADGSEYWKEKVEFSEQ